MLVAKSTRWLNIGWV